MNAKKPATTPVTPNPIGQPLLPQTGHRLKSEKEFSRYIFI